MDVVIECSVIKWIEEDLYVDEVIVEYYFVLIMVVGEVMCYNVGIMVRVVKVLLEVQVNIEMINQGFFEVSMMFGVKEVEERKVV